jgi:hypothetical protein
MPSMAGQVFPRAALSSSPKTCSSLGFGFVLLERGRYFFRLGAFRHFRQRLQDLLFRIVDVLQAVEEQILQSFCRRPGFS